MHRGITWRHIPGSSEDDQKLNFALFRRGEHRLSPKCGDLEGEALIQRLRELTESNRINGRKGGLRLETRKKRLAEQARSSAITHALITAP